MKIYDDTSVSENFNYNFDDIITSIVKSDVIDKDNKLSNPYIDKFATEEQKHKKVIFFICN